MSCEWETRLDPYVDSALPESESKEVQAHLLACAACAARALELLQMKQMVRAAGRRFAPSGELRRRIEQSIARRRRNWMTRWAPVWAAAALLLVAGIGALWTQRLRASEQALSELTDVHISTLASANRVEVASSDRHTVKPWFQGRIPFTFNLPELKGTSFQLIGGRVVYFEQSAGAQLLFAEGKHTISVFLFQDRGTAARLGRGTSPGTELTFYSARWEAGGLRYVAIGDVAPAELHRLRELFESAGRS